MKRLGLFSALFGLTILFLAACQGPDRAEAQDGHGHAHEDHAALEGVTKAVCVIRGTAGNEKVQGVVTFTQEGDKLKVVADLEGLTPGQHGFHIHEWGDLRSADGTSLGGHYNPQGHPHGAPGQAKSHAGDFGNVTAGDDGKAHLELELSDVTLTGKSAILGRGMVVHAGTDDLKSQPTGDAGGRVGVGVIGVAKPE